MPAMKAKRTLGGRLGSGCPLCLSLLKNLFGLRIGWQAKITPDDIDDISSVAENVGHRL
jgi:hypothetical protein